MDFRVGFGYDVHRLVENRDLVLGGVNIPHHMGLLGHSDADVLLHAVCDAILGAAGLGDIGMHFPDSDASFKDISSMILLENVAKKIKDAGLKLNNLDATIVAQAPKLAPYIPNMRHNIASCLKVEEGRVNIKATTTEGLGFTGKKEGIASYCVVTLRGL
ncbi:MAG: 2-C-methyl-D-erythritol 2,4-cyclodiphosphate synthase [Thermodesulfobacteria bacterium]|nr:2-C-methyl-D-erythritol 2,4-cyclodiphosphate synthase [Thermodesulfobacteriota bacterium]